MAKPRNKETFTVFNACRVHVPQGLAATIQSAAEGNPSALIIEGRPVLAIIPQRRSGKSGEKSQTGYSRTFEQAWVEFQKRRVN